MPNENEHLFTSIKDIILVAHQRVFLIANTALLETYWEIGHLIVEYEQKGKEKADYGKGTLKTLAKQLTKEFGKGFDESNLRNRRSFYRSFPIRDAMRRELSWTHYRLLCRLDTEEKKELLLKRIY